MYSQFMMHGQKNIKLCTLYQLFHKYIFPATSDNFPVTFTYVVV